MPDIHGILSGATGNQAHRFRAGFDLPVSDSSIRHHLGCVDEARHPALDSSSRHGHNNRGNVAHHHRQTPQGQEINGA